MPGFEPGRENSEGVDISGLFSLDWKTLYKKC